MDAVFRMLNDSWTQGFQTGAVSGFAAGLALAALGIGLAMLRKG